jgi:phosphoserine phosphatase RsbU/P
MNPNAVKPESAASVLTRHGIEVLLIDDQPMIGEAVRRMLASEPDIRFHYCNDPAQAIKKAEEISPTVILQDLVMPGIDGLTLVKYLRANAKTRDLPLIVLSTKEEPVTKAEAFALGANDYLVKLPDKVELIARIRHHSRGYINYLERNEAYRALVASQQALAAELAEAAAYVQSLLPPPLEGAIRTHWKYIPSTQLGGDAFGYHWLDHDHLCLYLLDVCGHGVGAALLSISAMNVMRSQALPNTNFCDPGETLSALNEAFQMEKHNNMYFTIWYGVYQPSNRTLRFASAGHPPALLMQKNPEGIVTTAELTGRGMVLGAMPGMVYTSHQCNVPEHSVLYVLSDGTYEITQTDGSMWNFEDFTALLARATADGKSEIEELSDFVHQLHGKGPLEDDFSIVKFQF